MLDIVPREIIIPCACTLKSRTFDPGVQWTNFLRLNMRILNRYVLLQGYEFIQNTHLTIRDFVPHDIHAPLLNIPFIHCLSLCVIRNRYVALLSYSIFISANA
jgi:hypothetical protein